MSAKIKLQRQFWIFLLTFATQVSNAAERKTVFAPWIRLTNDATHVRLSPNSRYVAFTDGFDDQLKIVELSSGKIFAVSQSRTDGSYVWTPDGHRLIYREIVAGQSPERSLASRVMAYDAGLKKSVMIDELAQATGLLTLDPRDQRIQIMGERSVISHQIILPEQRMAKWQMASRVEQGKWLATPKAMLWTSLGGRSLQSMTDDGQGLESFAISPDGQSAAWATKLGKVYMSRNGGNPAYIGPGRDPSWHPTQNILLYAAARMVGDKATDYDLRLIDSKGVAKWVTQTQHSAERWPQWMPKADQILYTKERTTDLFVLDFQQ